jgi:hypothetical protein
VEIASTAVSTSRSGSGKPPLPLSARTLSSASPRTGRSGVTTLRASIKPGDLPKAVKDLSSPEWKKKQDAMTYCGPRCREAGRSTLAEVATDMIGLI